MSRLKAETRNRHEQLERTVGIEARLASTEAYRTLLARFFGFFEPLEAIMAARPEWQGCVFDFERRRGAPRLEKDLAALGVSAVERAALPRCGGVPVLDSFPKVLGALYVHQGATLGGQIIARRVRETLSLTPEHGAAYFSGAGPDTGRAWREVGALLAANAVAPADAETIVAAADETFGSMADWLAPLAGGSPDAHPRA